jgi:Holliday junction DNA helicase RuvA
MGVIGSFRPQEAAVEETFVNKDARATLKLGQARGMALLAPAQRGLPVAEYPPNVVKKTVTGTGHGEKRQIAAMVGFLLPKAKFDSADEADALAIAICHASRSSRRRSRRGGEGGSVLTGACTPSARGSPPHRAEARLHDVGRVSGGNPNGRCSAMAVTDGTSSWPQIGKLRHRRRRRRGTVSRAWRACRGLGATLRALQPARGEPRSRRTREDAIRLYGFTSEVERSWFRTLQTIQGVGAKVALAVLGTLSTQDLANAIALQNWAAVEQSPGVGKKLAQRIVAELKDKAPALSVAGLNVAASGRKGGPASTEDSAAAEAISALTNLGYQPAQASQAVAAAIAELGQEADTPKLIRRGLKELAR